MDVPRNTILQGDALSRLRELPDGSVQCVVTSPPYWSLRAYQTAPQIWGGSQSCDHQWGATTRAPWANSLPGPKGRVKNVAATRERSKDSGPYCGFCGAWRGELGQEPTVAEYVEHLVMIFEEVKRVLRPDGVCWVNIGDSYAGSWGNYAPRGIKGTQRERHDGGERWERKAYGDTSMRPASTFDKKLKPKDLCMVPFRVAIALQEAGWWIRSDVVWCKGAPMPESVEDRPVRAHEYVFMATRSERYFYDHIAVRQPAKESSIARISQPSFHLQGGGTKDYGEGSNRSMRRTLENYAARSGRAVDKQRGHSRRHSGFNDRWDAMSKDEQQALGSNLRDFWVLGPNPFPAAHFAVMPESLAETPILCSTSPYACEVCGSPWQRKMERTKSWREGDPGRSQAYPLGSGNRRLRDSSGGMSRSAYEHVGWEPTCKCKGNTGAGHCLVLDPFFGSGTVGVVAQRLGRDYLGLELNEKYVQLARQRILNAGGRNALSLVTMEKTGVTQPGLFENSEPIALPVSRSPVAEGA